MLQLTRSSLISTEPPDSVRLMGRAFDEHHAIRLPQFLDLDLLAYVQDSIRAATFCDRDDAEIAREARMSNNPMLAMMCLIMNDGRLFDFIRSLTGCAPIGYFDGRVYAFYADANHYDRWHSDASDDRRVGISINLSDGEFTGGVFELRHVASDTVQWSLANTQPGDAILFRIREDLRHRVTPVTGPIPRIAYAGWFQGGKDLLTLLKNADDGARITHESMQYTHRVPTT